MVQAPPHRACDQESARCHGHTALHCPLQVVHQPEADGGLRRVGHHGGPRADKEPRVWAHPGQVDDVQRDEGRPD